MTDRLTDEQVARVATWAGAEPEVWTAVALAREVQEHRALRPTCPTCEAGDCDCVSGATDTATPHGYHCPNCEDGKMPLAEWVALLIETLHTARRLHLYGDVPERFAPIDAVLKMAGRS
jgi:hypothetical protein